MLEKPTVKSLLKHAENRYALVIAVSRRAREIAIEDEKEDISPVTLAANELLDGKVYISNEDEAKENDFLKKEEKDDLVG